MQYRTFGRTGWPVSVIGYGMWGLGGWSGSDDDETGQALQRGVDLGCTFFDTAWGYGNGKSERILGELVRANPDKRLYTATKLPPKNRVWPSHRGDPLEGSFPPDHIREYTEKSLTNLGLSSVDLIQFHVWEDDWANDERWQRAVDDLKREGLVRAVGISINRWEPENALRTIKTGLIDSVQVIYNIFDQAPEDTLFPACRAHNVAVIARVPFDEGSLIGDLTVDSRWPEGDWRNTYFVPENLVPTVAQVAALKKDVQPGMSLPDLALRFILANQDVATIIPGMRKVRNVEANFASADAPPLPADLLATLRAHRWDRQPTAWSQ